MKQMNPKRMHLRLIFYDVLKTFRNLSISGILQFGLDDVSDDARLTFIDNSVSPFAIVATIDGKSPPLLEKM